METWENGWRTTRPNKKPQCKKLILYKICITLQYKVFCTFKNFNSGLMVEEEKNAQSNFFES